MIFRRTSIAMCTTAVFCGLTFAQPPAPPAPPTPAQMVAHEVQRLSDVLSLNSDQQTKATSIFTTAESSLSSVRAGMKSAHSALITAIEANDTNGISTAATQIGNLTAQEIQAHAEAQAAFYAILTPEQQTKYKEMLPMGPHGFGPRGLGAPPPPPPPPAE